MAERPEPDPADLDGAPLAGRGRHLEVQLVRAERAIAQLRTIIGALAARDGGEVHLDPSQLADPRARRVTITAQPDGSFDLVTRDLPRAEPAPQPRTGPRPVNPETITARLSRVTGKDQEKPAG
jgi:hypothetical protein